ARSARSILHSVENVNETHVSLPQLRLRHYQSEWPTRLLGENVKIYSEPIAPRCAYTPSTGARKGFVCQKSVALRARPERGDWSIAIRRIKIRRRASGSCSKARNPPLTKGTISRRAASTSSERQSPRDNRSMRPVADITCTIVPSRNI